MSAPPGVDPITFEVVRNGLESIADEMAFTVVRSARANMIKDCMDFSTAVCDARGSVISQALTIPLMLCAFPDALAAVLERFQGDLREGDVLLLNDPFEGGSHLPDVFLFKPVFHGGALAAFMATCAHHADVGGMAVGSAASDATEVFQEGLRIPPLKLYEGGRPNETLLALLRRNVRFPEILLADLHAQVAACRAGERAYGRLIARYGLGELDGCLEALMDHSELITRREIAALPDGTYTFTDHLDEDGLDPEAIPITVAVTIEGEELTADFTGTAPMCRGSLNCSLSFTKACVYTAVKCITRADIPENSGFFRPIHVVAPPGTVVHAVFPAATFMRGLTGYRINNVLFGALAQAAPHRVVAADEGGTTIVLIDGHDGGGERFMYMETISGTWGARPDKDGIDCASNVTGLQSNVPVEVLESEYPIRVERYGFIPDSGGAGRFRGGLGLLRQYRYLAEEGNLQVRADRVRFAPYGLFGGRPGARSKNLLVDRGGLHEELEAKVKRRLLRRGDVFLHLQAGGGGYGPPWERGVERVVEDVRDGKVSPLGARRDYGVVLDPESLEVDQPATAALRAAMARAAGEERPLATW